MVPLRVEIRTLLNSSRALCANQVYGPAVDCQGTTLQLPNPMLFSTRDASLEPRFRIDLSASDADSLLSEELIAFLAVVLVAAHLIS